MGKRAGRAGQRIIQLMQSNPQITISEMAVSLEISGNAGEKQVRKPLERKIIGRVSPAEGGHWEIPQ